MQQAQTDAEAAAKEAKATEEKQTKTLKDAQAEFAKENKEMLGFAGKLKIYGKKLRKSTPEIVAQHKLGLLHQNATTTTTTQSSDTTFITTTVTASLHHHHRHHHH